MPRKGVVARELRPVQPGAIHFSSNSAWQHPYRPPAVPAVRDTAALAGAAPPVPYPRTVTETQPRGDLRPPGIDADEATTLLTFLDYLRNAVAAKTADLAEQEARRPGVPSGTSLLGLVKHLAAVEHNWFVWAYTGAGEAPLDDEAPVSEGESVHDVLVAYRDAVARSNAVVASCPDLIRPGARSLRETPPPSMRWILVHMIEETARHAGHADILREQIDGSTGR